MIEEQYVSRDTSRMLKEAGFDEVCRSAYYSTGNSAVMHERNSMLSPGYISRPTQALAARWLREVHGIHVAPNIFMDSANDADGNIVDEWTFWSFDLFDNSGRIIKESDNRYDTYEEALEAGLKHCLELIKK